MGRELQKKKNRSSTSKVTQKAKSKRKLLHNPIIAANW
jgi:nucleolar protein 16